MKDTRTLQGEELRNHLTETLDIDFDKRIIYIINQDQYDMFNDINAEHQYQNGDNAFNEWISWNMFDGEGDWFLFIDVLGYGKKFQYNRDGELEKSVSLTDNTWYIKDEA